MMKEVLQIKEIEIAIERKNIKNMYLKVRPPLGEVVISAPNKMKTEVIKIFASQKLPWIRKQQQKIQSQPRQTPHLYVDNESHYLWGKSYLLKIVETNQSPQISLAGANLLLHLSPHTCLEDKKAVISNWYRRQLKQAIPPIINQWQPVMGVKVNKFFIQQMKTKWGSCNVTLGNIRLNLELAKKPPECLEYVVVHEMTHLLEASHNHRFKSLMDQFMPSWRHHQQTLKNFPLISEASK